MKKIFVIVVVLLLTIANSVLAQGTDLTYTESLLEQIKELREQIIERINDRIAELTEQLNRATENSVSSGQTNPGFSLPSDGGPSVITANSSAGGGSNLPFGGKITFSYFCDASITWWLKLSPPAGSGGLPTDLIYRPGAKLYAYYQPTKAGNWLLGTWKGQDECAEWDGPHRRTVKIANKIFMVGTSGGSDGSGTGDSGESPQPTVTATPAPSAPPDACKRMGDQAYSYQSYATGYYPADNAMEGGFEDRRGAPLQTLADYLQGKASYVSVAMDPHVFPYGTELCIPEMDQKYGRQIVFRVVDTGGAFIGKGTSKIDICKETEQDTFADNGPVTLVSRIPSAK